LVASLARPGGNLTGFSPFQIELMPKRLELLTELVPQARVIALLVNPNEPRTEGLIRDMQEAARAKGVQLPVLKAAAEGEIDAAFASLVDLHADALVLGPDPLFNNRRDQIVVLAARHAVPAISPWRELAAAGGLISHGASFTTEFVAAGGLMSYSASRREIGQLVGDYAGRILKGAAPADLPVIQSTRFELVINLETAKALGLTIPHTVLLRADEVIE
jgi:putative ABC transport system substrate-binding protein